MSIRIDFTTPAYRQEAFRLILREANIVANQLNLPEDLPIRESDLKSAFISPFGYAYQEGRIGNITTAKYWYGVEADGKFSDLVVANYDKVCFDLRDQGKLPVKVMDTNAAYRLATQWLAAVSIDLKQLNRDCRANVAVSPFWNGLGKLGQKPKHTFVPIYYVWWTSPQNIREGYGSVADVELHLPTKTLIQLIVEDPRYILRKPLLFTNLGSLFPGTALIFTNHPVKPVIVNLPGPR